MKNAIAVPILAASAAAALVATYISFRPATKAAQEPIVQAERQQPQQAASGAFVAERLPPSAGSGGLETLRLYGQLVPGRGGVTVMGSIPFVSGHFAIIHPTGFWQILVPLPYSPSTPHGVPITVTAVREDGSSASYTATIP